MFRVQTFDDCTQTKFQRRGHFRYYIDLLRRIQLNRIFRGDKVIDLIIVDVIHSIILASEQ